MANASLSDGDGMTVGVANRAPPANHDQTIDGMEKSAGGRRLANPTTIADIYHGETPRIVAALEQNTTRKKCSPNIRPTRPSASNRC